MKEDNELLADRKEIWIDLPRGDRNRWQILQKKIKTTYTSMLNRNPIQ